MADSSESDTAYDPKNDSASEDEVEDVQIAKKEVNKISKKRKLTDETPESEKTLKDEKGNTYWEVTSISIFHPRILAC
ncbi:hypothetical protein NQZ79_g4787 [Umbelopsis isabellina]|nr:hypothetical protein NQZ79_g4787 [Umbelopsis isabellina]